MKHLRSLFRKICNWFSRGLSAKQIMRAGEAIVRTDPHSSSTAEDIITSDYKLSDADATEKCIAAAMKFWDGSIPKTSLSAKKRRLLLAAIEEQYRLGLSRSFIASVSSNPYYNGFESCHSRKSAYDRYKSACEKAGLSPKKGGDKWLHGAYLICTIDTDNWEVSCSPGPPDLEIVIYPKRNPA